LSSSHINAQEGGFLSKVWAKEINLYLSKTPQGPESGLIIMIMTYIHLNDHNEQNTHPI
jgi:hypothetical protein